MSELKDPFVRVSVRNSTGLLELNRPKALNSLNVEMIELIDEALNTWRDDPAVHRVIISSLSPKAFCAGGDVRYAREGDPDAVDHFFATEYHMNGDLSEYPKPVVALIDGVVMGGGLGISAHGSHRVVSENALAAMPEMAIGYFPDVGIPWMFQHMRNREGDTSYAMAVFLTVTGYRLDPADMLYSGLATHFVPSEKHSDFRDMAIAESLDEALEEFAEEGAQDSALEKIAGDIEATFNHHTWAEIDAALKAHPNREFVELVRGLMEKANPTSVVAAVEFMAAVTRCTDIRQELALETVLGEHLRRDPNFSEGVRAVLVDKCRNPSFSPDNYEDVDVEALRKVLGVRS